MVRCSFQGIHLLNTVNDVLTLLCQRCPGTAPRAPSAAGPPGPSTVDSTSKCRVDRDEQRLPGALQRARQLRALRPDRAPRLDLRRRGRRTRADLRATRAPASDPNALEKILRL